MEDINRKRVAMELREQYMGLNHKPKRQILKRFSFDWPLFEDTSDEATSIVEAPLLFGRGFRAGIGDRLEQLKKMPSNCKSCWSAKKLADMTPRDFRIFQEDFDISYEGSRVHARRPMRNWEESGLSHDILKAVRKAGYFKPSPIQMAAIPIGLAHVDMIGIAQTGSGKTASFVLPILHHISSLPSLDIEDHEVQGPYALVMAPTRELAQQIHEETLKLSRYQDAVKVVTVVGGHSIEKQGMELSHGCDIIIATPGRLLDCLERKFVVLNRCKHVVLDEADRMVAMGFEEQVLGVLNALPLSTLHDKVTICMFSATMPSAVKRIAQQYLTDHVTINIGTKKRASDLITQQVIMVKNSEKLPKLQALLDTHGRNSLIMVFVNSRDMAYSLERELKRRGYKATSLHGGMSQGQREASLKSFKSKQFNCLVATDVAGRGIDIPDVVHVVNYEMPGTIQKYTHRIGRTGRAGNTGFATTFLTHSDTKVFYDLKEFLIHSNSIVPPELACHEASKIKPGTFKNYCL